jgi:hypothetical protein
VLQACSIFYIANLWIVCGVYQFSSLKCELASCLKAHPWTYPKHATPPNVHREESPSFHSQAKLEAQLQHAPAYFSCWELTIIIDLRLTLNTFATFWIPVKKFHKECRSHGAYMHELTLTSIIIHLGDWGSTWQSIYRVRWTCDNNQLGIMAIFARRWMVPSMFPTCTYNAQAVKTMISVPLN